MLTRDPSPIAGTFLVLLTDLRPTRPTGGELRCASQPATQAKKISYVELVAFAAQRPKWFVSHWWGEPAFDFVACLDQHSADHKYEDCAYWVCA